MDRKKRECSKKKLIDEWAILESEIERKSKTWLQYNVKQLQKKNKMFRSLRRKKKYISTRNKNERKTKRWTLTSDQNERNLNSCKHKMNIKNEYLCEKKN
jgi:hypothetical protein